MVLESFLALKNDWVIDVLSWCKNMMEEEEEEEKKKNKEEDQLGFFSWMKHNFFLNQFYIEELRKKSSRNRTGTYLLSTGISRVVVFLIM